MSVVINEPSGPDEQINVQVFVPDHQIQKCLQVHLDDIVWDIKQKILSALPKDQTELFNYGLFLPPCNGRAGKFLLEERPIKDYPFQDCVPYLELKYKRRVYKMLSVDEKLLKQLHSKASLKKFMELVAHLNREKIDKLLNQGLDPNFHDPRGETPLTLAATIPNSRDVMMTLVAGGAHLDFRNAEGQTALHKAVFCDTSVNVKGLLELGASPNCKDPLGLTPLYYCMLQPDTSADTCELLLRDYAQLGVTDMHGNTELHQACKNGLHKHVEHLLYYGARLDVQNMNGNSPLHVCAVNNRESCARVLLFRGANMSLCNNTQQTASQVAAIVSSAVVADVIRSHDPSKSVPYRGAPSYNHKRRMARSTSSANNTLGRTRSISQSSMASSASSASHNNNTNQHMKYIQPPNANHYQQSPNMQQNNTNTINMRRSQTSEFTPNQMMTSPNVNDRSNTMSNARGRDMDGHNAQPSTSQLDALNPPRTVLIPRGPKGFGFILRGAKKMEPGVRFEPSVSVPALQFFEGVDVNGRSMRAGLRPGDFLIEINSVDVRRAEHDQVVSLIHVAGDTIQLKVVTVDPTTVTQRPPAPPHFGTMPNRRNAGAQQRGSTDQPHDSGNVHGRGIPPAKSMEQLDMGYRRMPPSQSQPAGLDNGEKVASVRSRGDTRRISAVELEQLMARHGQDQEDYSTATIQRQHSNSSVASSNNTAARKYNSVADMKRRKAAPPNYRTAPAPPPPPPGTSHGNSGLPRAYGQMNSFASTPNLQDDQQSLVFEDNNYGNGLSTPRGNRVQRRPSQCSTTSSEYRSPRNMRPKTPPPPPPVMPGNNMGATKQKITITPSVTGRPPPPPPPPPISGLLNSGPAPVRSGSGPPPPPPPPSMDMLKTPGKEDCRGITADALKQVRLNKTPTQRDASGLVISGDKRKSVNGTGATPSGPSKMGAAPPQGITAAALGAVRLKSANANRTPNNNNTNGHNEDSERTMKPRPGALDFDSDLKRALAKRRNNSSSKVEDTASANTNNVVYSTSNQLEADNAKVNTRSSLSLKESVRQSVQAKPKSSSNRSPPPPVTNGFNKKDSGYTSSRTSLEPSECGDDAQGSSVLPNLAERDSGDDDDDTVPPSPDFPPPPPPEMLQASLNGSNVRGPGQLDRNRVSVLSQQLEDSFGGQPPPQLPNANNNTLKPRPPLNKPNSQSNMQASCNVTTINVNSGGQREHDSMSVTSTLSTLSGCSGDSSRPSHSRGSNPAPRIPRPDYEADSGTGDSEADDHTPHRSNAELNKPTSPPKIPSSNNVFSSKRVPDWSIGDACDWLCSLQLSDQYVSAFASNKVDGTTLMRADRAFMTKMKVTNITHRKAIEHSLKQYMPN